MGRPGESEYHSEAGPFQNAFYQEFSTFAENELEPDGVVHVYILSPQMVSAVVSRLKYTSSAILPLTVLLFKSAVENRTLSRPQRGWLAGWLGNSD